MVAYSFNRQFADPIRAMTKRQTLRDDRKRHAYQGETLQLYTGMRTRQCRLIGTARCIAASPIRIYFNGCIEFLDGVEIFRPSALEAFARADGFADFEDLKKFWAKNHPAAYANGAWQGVRIAWGETFVPAVERDGKMVPA